MKIALIFPKVAYSPQDVFEIDGYARIMHGYPPLSLAYVAAIIEKAGHQARIIDANIVPLGIGGIVREIKKFSPDLLGFTVTTITFHETCRWIEGIKKQVALPVMVGGALVGLYPREIMQQRVIDYACIGPAIDLLPRFLTALENKQDYSGISGLCFRKGDTVVVNEQGDDAGGIERLPFPARHLLPNDRYGSPFSRRKNFTALVTAQGCRFGCLYCCLPGKPSMRSAGDVVGEIEECYRSFGVRDIDIYDSVFTAGRERVIDICCGIRKKRLSISWNARTHINLIDRHVLEEMAGSGCRMLMYGIESIDPEILRQLGRAAVTAAQIKEAVALTKKAGIAAFGFFMLGAPGETRATMQRTLEASRSLGFDLVQFSRLTVIPGTPLYETYRSAHHRDYWKDFILRANGRQEHPFLETDLPPRLVAQNVKKAMFRFYFRPGRLCVLLLSIRDIRQLFLYLGAGLSMLGSRMKIGRGR